MTRAELSQKHWKYYLMLEKRFLETMDYVELHEDNFNAFSNSYALLLQAIGAELDSVFKEFCGFGTDERKTITDYARHILSNMPDVVEKKIILQEYGIVIQPFEMWDINQPGQSLQWWNAYISVKHNRFNQMSQANQKNTLNILGALFLIEMLLLKSITENTTEIDVFDESSTVFTLKNWTTKVVPVGEAFEVLGEMLTDNYNATRAFDV